MTPLSLSRSSSTRLKRRRRSFKPAAALALALTALLGTSLILSAVLVLLGALPVAAASPKPSTDQPPLTTIGASLPDNLLSANTSAAANLLPAINFYNLPEDPENAADILLSELSDEELLAQCLMFGWVGAEPSPLVQDWVRKRRIGGIKIFGWNTENTQLLAESVGILQQAAADSPYQIPLLVATDQEGGWIRHVKGLTSETPGNMAIGASGFPHDAYLAAYFIGRELAALGINMNFAPTVDLYTNTESSLIGPRAFGDDPTAVAILGAAFAKGSADAGIIATAKHYPGHGATALDSHGTLPLIEADIDLLWERELLPYRILIKEQIPAVMSGHLAFPNTPAGLTPASISSWFLIDLLRERLGFNGLVITDDLLMYGVVKGPHDLPRAAREAMEAGNDLLLVSITPEFSDPLWSQLLRYYHSERPFRERVQQAARRVLITKLRYLRSDNRPPLVPDSTNIAAQVPDPEGQNFFQDLAGRSVTRVLGKDDSLPPLTSEKAGKVLLAGQFDDFFKAGRLAYPKAEIYRFSYLPFYDSLPAEQAALATKAASADTIIICLANPASLDLVNSLKDLGKKVIVISALTPVYLEQTPWVDVALAVYSYAPSSFIAGFSALTGRIPALGRLPFQLARP